MADRLQEIFDEMQSLLAEARGVCERREIINTQWKPIRFNERELTLLCDGKKVKLASSLQFRLFRLAWNSKNHRLTEERAARRIWGSEETSSKTIYRFIMRTEEALATSDFPYSLSLETGVVRIFLASEVRIDTE